ncbi:laminin B domain-containing protein [Actinokineospora sp. UTMC 2448]|uniref:RCC1 domain-containing protein n=1 Tax=Actinokineospora sp. UTMC 2448 TaxID=2268449 RepID=UPI002164B9D2|nr:laminin B domain-containing protein [Actinokineospora sp. UTMC 2448]
MGAIRYQPEAVGPWWFAAPARLLGDRSACAGGSLSVTFAFAPSATGENHIATPGRGLVLRAGGAGLTIDAAAAGFLAPRPEHGTRRIDVPLRADAGWLDEATGRPATEPQLRLVLAALDTLLVPGAPVEHAAWTELRAVRLGAEPAALALTVRQRDGGLVASWPVTSDESHYEVRVHDGTGTLVHSTVVPADEYTPPVPLSSDTFIPEQGMTYTVELVTGTSRTSALAAVTHLTLEKPAIRSHGYVVGGYELIWHAVDSAESYDFQVLKGTVVVHSDDRIKTCQASAGLDQGLVADTGYRARVRANAGGAAGPWSDEYAFELLSATTLLNRLSSRLQEAGGSGSVRIYPLNPKTLPGGESGLAEQVRTVLTSFDASPIVSSTEDPVLTPGQKLTLSGVSNLLGGEGGQTTVVFTVSEKLQLRFEWRTTLPAHWSLSRAFPQFAGTAHDALPLRDALLLVTGHAHRADGVFFTLQPGLSLQATLPVRTGLLPPPRPGDPLPSDTQTVRVGGPFVNYGWNDPRWGFAWQGEEPLSALTISTVGGDPMTLTGGRVSLASEAKGDTLLIHGKINLGGGRRDCSVGIPTLASETLTATTAGWQSDTLSAALTALGIGDPLASRLPNALVSLAKARISELAIHFAPTGERATRTTATIMLGTSWTPAGKVTLADPAVAVTVTRTPRPGGGAPVVAWKVRLTGQITLGTSPYRVEATVPARGAWRLRVTGSDTMPPLADVAALTGATSGSITNVLPEALRPNTTVKPTRVELHIDPFTTPLQAIQAVGVTLAQTTPWTPIADQLTLFDWAADLDIAQAGGHWAVSGLLSGKVGLGKSKSPAFAVSMAVPFGPDAVWRVALDPDTVVTVPTIGELLALVTDAAGTLPSGLSSLGGLKITGFDVAMTPSPLALRHLAFAFAQSGTWTVIDGALAVRELRGDLLIRRDTGITRVTGSLSGVLTLGGTPVGLLLSRETATDGWTLRAAYADPVHVPRFSSLESWLAPIESAAALPTQLPLTNGFDVGDVHLRFGGTGGTLDRVGFAVAIPEAWTVVQGKLALTDVRARLSMPYPVGLNDVTGEVSGVVTIAGAAVLVTAKKPGSGDDWEFAGTLQHGFTIDLVSAARQIGESHFDLPSAAIGKGLPKAIELTTAAVKAVPSTGAFHATAATRLDWRLPLATTLRITSLGATLAKDSTTAPLKARVTGTLESAGIRAALSLALGTADTPAILDGSITNPAAIEIAAAADALANPPEGEGWTQVVPADIAKITFERAALHLDLTTPRALLYGKLGFGTASGIDALLYCATDERTVAAGAAPWSYAVALRMGPGFRFGLLTEHLKPLDNLLTVSDARVVVCNLSEGTLKELAETTTKLLKGIDKNATPPLGDLPKVAVALKTGAYLAARVNGSSPLLAHLAEIGKDGKAPEVALYALIDRAQPTNTTFAADLPDITIFDTITLTHTANHPGIHLTYQPNKNRAFSLAGCLKLGLFKKTYAFDVELTCDDKGLTSRARQTGQELRQPFGLPGFTLTQLAVAVTYTWAKVKPPVPKRSQFTLEATAAIGPAPKSDASDDRLRGTAKLALLDGAPTLVYATVDTSVGIAGFLTRIASGGGVSWPADFIELRILEKSRVYYYDQAKDPGKKLATFDGLTFNDGFHLDAGLRLTLVGEVSAHADIAITREAQQRTSGVSATIALKDPVDFGFMQLAGTTLANGVYTGGPALKFERTATRKRFAADAGINFFGEAFSTVSVTVARQADKGRRFTGRLEAARALPPFGTLKCGFTYTTHPGKKSDFAIQDWPSFEWLENIIGIAKAITAIADAAGNDACGAIAGQFINNAYDEKLTVTPKVSLDGTDVVFTLRINLTLTLRGAKEKFLDHALPSLAIKVPAATKWAALPEALKKGVADGAEGFAKDVLSDPKTLALIAAMIAGRKAVECLASLVCKGLADAAASAAAAAALVAIEDAGGFLAAGAAAAAAAAIAGALADSAQKKKDQGNEDDGSRGGSNPTPGRPTILSMTYQAGKITGCWDSAPYATGYEFEVLKPDGQSLEKAECGRADLTASLAVTAEGLPAGIYTCRVRALRQTNNTRSQWAQWPLEKPSSPTPELHFGDDQLTATFAGRDKDVYWVSFTDPSDKALGDMQKIDKSPYSAHQPLANPSAGRYGAQVRVERACCIPADWSPKATLNVLAFDAPSILEVWWADSQVHVVWNRVHKANSYEVKAFLGATEIASGTTSAPTTRLSLTAQQGKKFTPGSTYTVQVRARGADGESPWSTKEFTVPRIPQPANVALSTDADQLIASWDGVRPERAEAVVAYDVRLFATTSPQHVIGAINGITSLRAVLRRDDDQPLVEGTSYGVRVRARVGRSVGPWSADVNLRYRNLPAPASPMLEFRGTTLVGSWQQANSADTSEQARSYEVKLSAGTVPLAGPVTVTKTTYEHPVKRPLATGDRCTLRVRALIPSHTSAWVRAEARYPGTVAITDAEYQGGAVNAVHLAWTASPLSDATYEVSLVNPTTGATIRTQPVRGRAGGLAPTTAEFPLTEQERGQTLRFAVAVRIGSSIGARSAPLDIAATEPAGAGMAWGGNNRGQLGDGTTVDRRTPVAVKTSGGHALTNVTAMAAGARHSLALTSDGKLFAWGDNESGQLGDGTREVRRTPVPVKTADGQPLTEVRAISTGADHSLALMRNGTVLAWGRNDCGQLGIGTTQRSNHPVQVKISEDQYLTDVRALAGSGWRHSVALLRNGTVMTWGLNVQGQLGEDPAITGWCRAFAAEVRNLPAARAVATGVNHVLALLEDGQILAWGSNRLGQLGCGKGVEQSHVPVRVKLNAGEKAKAVGDACGYHSVVILENGKVMAWGYNGNGQLGDGSALDRYEPVEVKTISGPRAVIAGYRHTIALLPDHTAMACGDNTWGQLGDDTAEQRNTLVAVEELAGALTIAAGAIHNLALKAP